MADLPPLSPAQIQQLRALAQAEALGEARAVTQFGLASFNTNVLVVLQAQHGYAGSRVKRGWTHYWLTPQGVERLKQEAARG